MLFRWTINRFTTKPRSVSSERLKRLKRTARDPSRNLFAQVFNHHNRKEREERKIRPKDFRENGDERKRDENRDREIKKTEENESDETEIEEIATPGKVQKKGTPVKGLIIKKKRQRRMRRKNEHQSRKGMREKCRQKEKKQGEPIGTKRKKKATIP